MRRRALLLSLAALAGCAKYGDENTPADAAGSPPAASAGGGGGGEVLVRASEVPVGGGTVLADRKIVVTQPAAGEFKAFSAVCTHQGCVVKDVSGGTINCPCHGSRFKVADASVAAGPAPRPLDPRQVTVKAGEVRLA
ncbi:Rieske (2Fe-2S) protein [Streptomyces sp. NPDC058691]|uniref:Rieske (2Fe-2S) protein n=1 Tax=Streptomyces sp. NPDC058691 TaxID=3346601 RepID=UPI0036541854